MPTPGPLERGPSKTCGGSYVISLPPPAIITIFYSEHLALLMSFTIFLGPGLAGADLFDLPEAARAVTFTRHTIHRAVLRVSNKWRHGVITRMMGPEKGAEHPVPRLIYPFGDLPTSLVCGRRPREKRL